MNVQEGKTWYSRIQAAAHSAVSAANNGNSQLTTGAVRKAAKDAWDEVQPGIAFETWWNEIHNIGTAPSNGVKKQNTDAFLNRYRDMAKKYPTLPFDPVLRDMWGCADGTLSSIRSRMKAEGFVFEEIAGGWAVINRPEPPKPPAPAPVPAPMLQPEFILTTENQAIITRLDTIIVLLRTLGDAWGANR